MFHLWLLLASLTLAQSPAGTTRPPAPTQTELAAGKQLFQAQCARCHGMLGLGGDGPSLARPVLRHAADEDALVSVISDGISGTGMPGIWALSKDEVRLVAGYVRSLGRQPLESVAGDAARGRRLFERNDTCTTCHIVNGAGRPGGPDLSDVGARRGVAYLREAIVTPAARLPEALAGRYPAGYAQFLPVRAVTRAGLEVVGTRVNEDTFAVQIRDATGRLHSLRKRELVSLEKYFDQSPMPSYRDQLTDAELDDLVAYLASLRGER